MILKTVDPIKVVAKKGRATLVFERETLPQARRTVASLFRAGWSAIIETPSAYIQLTPSTRHAK